MTASSWRDNQNKIDLAKMDKHFHFPPEHNMIITANAEWRAKDSKGWKKTYYIKEVRRKTDQIMSITP
jgi:hypothetical protein